MSGTTRRALLLAAATLPAFRTHAATPEVDALLAQLIGTRRRVEVPIAIEAPAIAETGNSVPVAVEVEHPMSAVDRVEQIHVIAPGNPELLVVSVHFTTACPRARFATRIRLARTQRLGVLALLSGDRHAQGQFDVVVTLGACIEEFFS